jgi:isoquinoline 1-oxidoreductase beta subunit
MVGSLVGSPRAIQAAMSSPAALAEFGPFIRIGADNMVTVMIKHLDKGQGVTTGLPTIVAEELDADWSQMRAEFAPADAARYNNLFFGPVQATGGSTSIANSWTQLREAAAAARAMLVGAAASNWGVDPGAVTVERGTLRHADSGREASFGELAEAASQVAPPQSPVLKSPDDFTLIGTRVPRLDSDSKTDGSAAFTLDQQLPGMVTALVAHPPLFGATVASFDAAKALAVPGVREVVRIPRGIAVVADGFWAASRGRDALDIQWDESAAETRGSEALRSAFEAALAEEGVMARNDGNVDQSIPEGEQVVRRRFRFPFLAHATMEPMDCVVQLKSDHCDIWTGAQLPTVDQQAAAQIAGLAPEQVAVHTVWAGGSFGRRAVPNSDYVAEAVMVAKAMQGDAPLKLIWTREDDMRAGFYRPMSVHDLEGALDADGNIVAWRHRTAVQSILENTPFEAMIQDGLDVSAVEGARELPYDIPNVEVAWHPVETGVPVLWWRSVGHTQNAFVVEAFIDELAVAAGKDPFELRRALLKNHPRHLAVLETAAEQAGWGSPLPEGRGRGIAVHESFGSFVAEVVEVTVQDDGRYSVDRVVCAVDCGIAVNPDVIRAQMEGAIGYGLSAALREEITLDAGRVEQGNFDRYRPLRINEMPKVEVHIIASGEAPTGVGEPATPPLGPALANALFAATGARRDVLPLGDRATA